MNAMDQIHALCAGALKAIVRQSKPPSVRVIVIVTDIEDGVLSMATDLELPDTLRVLEAARDRVENPFEGG